MVLFSGIVTFSGLGSYIFLVYGVRATSIRGGCTTTISRVRVVTRIVRDNGTTGIRGPHLGSSFGPLFDPRRCYRVIRGAGRCVGRNSVFRTIVSGELRTGVDNSLFRACGILHHLGPDPCVFCFSSGSVRVTNTSPRALIGLRGNALCACPLTNAQPHNGATRRSTHLRTRLLTSRGRLTRRGVLISLNEGSLNGVDHFNDIRIRGCRSVLGFDRIVRVNSAIHNGVERSGATLSTVSTILPTNALSNTPGVHTVRVVGRLRGGHHNVCNNTVKCVSFANGTSAYVTVHVTCGGNNEICIHSNTKVITSSINRGRGERYVGGTNTIIDTLGVDKNNTR